MKQKKYKENDERQLMVINTLDNSTQFQAIKQKQDQYPINFLSCNQGDQSSDIVINNSSFQNQLNNNNFYNNNTMESEDDDLIQAQEGKQFNNSGYNEDDQLFDQCLEDAYYQQEYHDTNHEIPPHQLQQPNIQDCFAPSLHQNDIYQTSQSNPETIQNFFQNLTQKSLKWMKTEISEKQENIEQKQENIEQNQEKIEQQNVEQKQQQIDKQLEIQNKKICFNNNVQNINIKQLSEISENCNKKSDENLNPFDEEDFVAPELHFELPDFTQIKDLKEEKDKQNNKTPLWKITQKIQKDKKQRDYDKNICRYISRCIVRCFVHDQYKSQIYKISQFELSKLDLQKLQQYFPGDQNCNIEVLKYQLYDKTREYLLGQIEQLNGHRALAQLLTFNDEEKYLEKLIFRKFTEWFLKHRAFRYILSGNMKDKQSYIKYKNKIMLHYIKQPEEWTSNHIRVRKR